MSVPLPTRTEMWLHHDMHILTHLVRHFKQVACLHGNLTINRMD